MKQRSHPPLLLISFFLLLCLTGKSLAAPALSANLDLATEGYFVLDWEPGADATGLVLQESLSGNFDGQFDEWSVAGAGQFTQSGLTNGTYFYRLVDDSGASNIVSVEVRHHSLARASLFFSLGAILFVILITVLIHGRRRQQGASSNR